MFTHKFVKGFASLQILFLSACASGSLQVSVDVLDKGYLDTITQTDTIRGEALKLLRGNFIERQKFMADTENIVKYYYHTGCALESIRVVENSSVQDSYKTNIISQLKVSASNPDQYSLVNDVQHELGAMRSALTLVDENMRHEIRTLHFNELVYNETSWQNNNRRLSDALVEKLINRRGKYNDQRIMRRKILDDAVTECANGINSYFPNNRSVKYEVINSIRDRISHNAANAAQRAVARSERTILGGAQLLATQEGAFHVVKAPEYAWARNYNESYGEGHGGSTDIAIKVNGVADYTVKGFSFDGRSTANMVRKLAVTTVGFAAGMAGIPIQVSNKDGTTTTEFNSPSVISANAAIVENAAQEQNFKTALNRIARTILASESMIITSCSNDIDCKAKKSSFHAQLLSTVNGQKTILD